MTTARDIVEAAWRRVTQSSSEDPVSAAEAADFLGSLNDYLHSLRLRGAAYTHNTLALGDDIQLPDDLTGPLKAVLARRMAEEFGAPVTVDLADAARDGRNLILGMLADPGELTVEPGLPGTSGEGRYRIDNG